MKRRDFLKYSANLSALALLHMAGIGCSGFPKGPIKLPKLPYPENALEPYISENTIGFHYGKHHQGYVNKLNSLINGSMYEKMSLEEIIVKTKGIADKSGVFNNAAQVFNHNFYWNSMKPKGGGHPQGLIAEKIEESFGSYDNFAEKFAKAAETQFASGWAWLVKEGNELKIMKTANADTPIAHGLTPILTIDVWEHAYYLDYQNRRADYIKVWLKNLVNWDFAEKNV